MMKYLVLLFCLFSSAAFSQNQSFISICYHDVKDVWDDDPMTVSTDRLINQLSWLKENHYHPVSVQDILDARNGLKALPAKAVLLSFDDGYRNFYQRIYPILKQFNYPAVFALVTSWMETPDNKSVRYGNELKPRSDFLSWEQVREMMDSGLIEIASHSHGLHFGISANPQGNKEPAAKTRQYFPALKRYETDREYQARILHDLQKSSDVLRHRTGKRPRVIVWPYGAYSHELRKIAQQAGMTVSVGLGEGVNDVSKSDHISRYLVADNPVLADYVYDIQHLKEKQPVRIVHVDMDYLYDDNPEQIEINLSKLLDRIKAMRVNTVYLQAFADPDGDGNADALYFPNRHMPVRADLFNRIAWQLRTRARVNVYAWMPVLAFQKNLPESWWVHERHDKQIRLSQNNYHRLSPFHPEARQFVIDIYRDLAKYAHFDGILFHDDALLTDFEDVSPAAQKAMQGMNVTQKLNAKIDALSGLTDELADAVRYYQPEIKTARNLYAAVIMQPESREWFAQDFSDFMRHYDYVAVMAMPYMENAEDPEQWLSELAKRIATQYPGGLKKTVFELQAVDWRSQTKVPDQALQRQMWLLQQNNALNFGYYPDDFYQNQPALSLVKEMMSLEIFPYGI